jgi:hypothetical protein
MILKRTMAKRTKKATFTRRGAAFFNDLKMVYKAEEWDRFASRQDLELPTKEERELTVVPVVMVSNLAPRKTLIILKIRIWALVPLKPPSGSSTLTTARIKLIQKLATASMSTRFQEWRR